MEFLNVQLWRKIIKDCQNERSQLMALISRNMCGNCESDGGGGRIVLSSWCCPFLKQYLTCDHIFNKVCVAGTIRVRIVSALRCIF
jgi:hypothetical protein